MSLLIKGSYRRLRTGGIALFGVGGLLIAALALAPVSGAYFSDTKTGQATVSTGSLSLELVNGSRTLDFAFDGIVPGVQQTQTFTVKNAGTVAGAMRFDMGAVTTQTGQSLSLRSLHYAVDGEGFSTGFDGNGASVDLGIFQAGQSKTFSIDAILDSAAGNDWQGVVATNSATVTLTQQE
jgi:hypothetical protein